jgi:hypothetical protein
MCPAFKYEQDTLNNKKEERERERKKEERDWMKRIGTKWIKGK